MAFLVTNSQTPLIFDALPALKVAHYAQGEQLPKIYSYARFYFKKEQLALELYAFEKQPAPTSCIGFALQGPPVLLVEARPGECRFYKVEQGSKTQLEVEASPYFLAGQDEQGWYWGASMVLPASFISLCKCNFAKESGFAAGVFKYSTERDGFGASAPIQNPGNMLDEGNFSHCKVVEF